MSSVDQSYDRTKYDITDCIARPVLRDEYGTPTPLINLIADYAKAIQIQREIIFAKIECPMTCSQLQVNLHQLSIEEYAGMLRLGLPANQNNIAVNLGIPLRLKSVTFQREEKNKKAQAFQPVMLSIFGVSKKQIKVIRCLEESCAALLARKFKSRFHGLKFEKQNSFEHDCHQIAQACESLLIETTNKALTAIHMRLPVSLQAMSTLCQIPIFACIKAEATELLGFQNLHLLVPPQSTGCVTINIKGICMYACGAKWSFYAQVCQIEKEIANFATHHCVL